MSLHSALKSFPTHRSTQQVSQYEGVLPMKSIRTRRGQQALAGLMTLALVAAACGSDDDNGAADTSDPPASAY
jgi:hypothetical protein